jgi:hypothetical protein
MTDKKKHILNLEEIPNFLQNQTRNCNLDLKPEGHIH